MAPVAQTGMAKCDWLCRRLDVLRDGVTSDQGGGTGGAPGAAPDAARWEARPSATVMVLLRGRCW
jgi:hypothetical protein